MKIYIYALMALILVTSVMSANANDTGVGVADLNFWQKVICYNYFPDASLYSLPATTVAAPSLITGWFSEKFSNIGTMRGVYCDSLQKTTEYLQANNNISTNITNSSINSPSQAELEDALFEQEKEGILTNINSAWDYNRLLIFIVIEMIKILFYIFEFYIVIFLILIALPKAFLKMRDGISIFLVRRHRNRMSRQGGK